MLKLTAENIHFTNSTGASLQETCSTLESVCVSQTFYDVFYDL